MNGFKLKIISLFVRSNDVSLHSSDPDIGFLGLFIFFFHFFLPSVLLGRWKVLHPAGMFLLPRRKKLRGIVFVIRGRAPCVFSYLCIAGFMTQFRVARMRKFSLRYSKEFMIGARHTKQFKSV